MFKVGDLVEVKTKAKSANNFPLIGLVETVVDGKVGVRYLNANAFGFNHTFSGITVYTNPLEFLKLCDKVDK